MIRITNEDQEAVARLLADEGLLQAVSQVTRVPDADRAPLSEFQQNLWLALNGGGARHANVPLVLKVSGGEVDVPALEQALLSIAERHEALRCLVVVKDDVAWQVPQPLDGVRLHVEDVVADSLDVRIDAVVNRPLDIRSELPYRLYLLRVERHLHYLIILTHHLVFDGWSIGLLQDELQTRYAQLLGGAPQPSPPAAPRHLDFALWQASAAGRESRQKGLEHWRRQLDGARSRQHWICARPAGEVGAHAGANLLRELPDGLSARVHAFAAAQRTTVFVVMMSAYVEVLSRYFLHDDVCVGTAASGRNQLDLEKVIGFFVNTLLLRYRCEPQQSFSTLLRVMDAQFRQAREHQDVPFHAVTRTLDAARGCLQPFTQAMFAYQTENSGTGFGFQTGGLTFEPYSYDLHDARYDLLLTVLSKNRQLVINFEYRTQVFIPAAVEQFADAYLRLLDAAIADPHGRLIDLGHGIHGSRIGPSVRQHGAPDQPITEHGRQRVSALTCALSQAGIDSCSRVALACAPCEAQALLLLALMRCGACCVVVDPEEMAAGGRDFADRLEVDFVLADAAYHGRLQGLSASVLDLASLSEACATTDSVSALALSRLVRVELDADGMVSGRIVFPGAEVLAVLAASNHVGNLAALECDPYAPIFDRAIHQLAACLVPDAGISTAMVDGIPVGSAVGGAQVLHRLSIDDLCTHLRPNAAGRETNSHLLCMPERVIDGTVCRVQQDGNARFDTSQAVILGRHGSAVAIGMPGELLLCGPGLAWGYVGDPRRTAERFTPDPDATLPGGRLLRTGVLSSQSPSGQISVLGHEQMRVDQQGVVFDLAEIEAAMLTLDGVVAARAQVDPDLDQGLVGISMSLMLDGSRSYSATELREHLAPRLPSKLLPSRFLVTAAPARGVRMDVDPTAFRMLHADRGGEPKTATEHIVASIWKRVLKVDDVQRNDDFNALGGDSIAAMKLVAELERIYDCQIDMATILLHPRLAAFCMALDQDDLYGEEIMTCSRLLREAYQARLRRDAARDSREAV